jgi:hypothetical protein
MVGTALARRLAAIFAICSLWPACSSSGSAGAQDAGSDDGSSGSSGSGLDNGSSSSGGGLGSSSGDGSNATTSSGSSSGGAQDASDGATDADAAASMDAGPLVAQCQALAMTFANNCYNEYVGDTLTPNTNRVCIWQSYAAICRTGRTQLLLDSMMCFGQNPNCWTFSDSNNAATCLNNLHAATPPSSALVAFATQYCGACNMVGGCADAGASLSGGTSEVFPYLTDAQLSQTSSCLADASCNASLPSSCTAVPELAIFACP